MSLRPESISKPLKGGSPTTALVTSTADATTTTAGTASTISAGNLENVFIFSGTADDLTIGAIIPAAGAFTELTVGVQGGPSGPVTFWGNHADNFVAWNPAAADFHIAGSLSVTDQVDLGNLRIYENTIEAIRPIPNGDINLLPQGNGQVAIEGNLAQTTQGYFTFPLVTDATLTANGTLTVDGNTSSRFSSRNGDLMIATDYVGDVTSFNVVSIITCDPLTFPEDFIPIPNAVYVTVTINGSNSPFIAGDTVVLANTSAITNVEGTHAVAFASGTAITLYVTSLVTPLVINGGLSGTLGKSQTSTLHLIGGSAVTMRANVPLQIGGGTRSQIVAADANSMLVSTDFLTIDDPIPRFRIPSGLFSDFGIQVRYTTPAGLTQTGFFGFQSTTQYFTWIPSATITRNTDGTKTVTGTRGIMQLEGVVINQLSGDPDLYLIAKRNIIFQLGQSMIVPSGINIQLGAATLTTNANGNLLLVSNGDLLVSPTVSGKGVVLKTGAPLTLNGAGGTQQITGSANGLNITSNSYINLTPPSGGAVNIPASVYLTFGNANQRIFGDASGLTVASILDINLVPNLSAGGVVRLPPNVKLVVGDQSSYLIGAGTGAPVTLYSGNTLNLGAAANVTISPNGGVLTSTGTFLDLPYNNTIRWGGAGTSSYLSVTPLVTTLNNTGPSAAVTLSAATNVNLQAGTSVNVPFGVPLTFGARGTIMQTTAAAGGLIIATASPDPLTMNAPSVIINGNLQVNGTTTYVSSTTTTFRDPVLHLSRNPPLGDVTSKGFQGDYYDGPYMKLAAFWFDPVTKRWTLANEATNNNEVLTANVLGTLELGTLVTQNMATTALTVNRIIGTPDIFLVADGGGIYLNATKMVSVPSGVPIQSGSNSITGGATGWNLNAPIVTVNNGALVIGSSTLTMTDINNLHVGGVPNVSIDALLNVQSTVTFAGTQTKISIDNQQNLVLTSPNNVVVTSNAYLNGGMTIGNAYMTWAADVPGGRVIWGNTSVTTPLYLSIFGSIYDATWMGNPIGLSYGGTGHVGAWTLGSVVFVDSGNNVTFLGENNTNFYWDNTTHSFGIRTNTPTHALTVGAGHVDMADSSANIFFRHNSLYAYSIGKTGTLLSVKTTAVPSVSSTMLTSALTLTANGQVGVGQSDVFMSGLLGASTEARLYVGGHARFTDPASQLQWSASQYLTSTTDGSLHVYTGNMCEFHSSTMHFQQARFLETASVIYGTAGGRIHVSTTNATYLRSPHTVHVGRCCYYHDPITDACYAYTVVDPASGRLAVHNLVGDIDLTPLSTVHFTGTTTATFGDAGQGTIGASGADFHVTSSARVVFDPNTSVSMIGSTPLVFGDVTVGSVPATATTLVQNTANFEINSGSTVAVNAPRLFVPDNSPMVFGHSSRSIMSDGVNLHVTGSHEIRLESNIIHVLGDLIVDGTTTQRFFTETQMETGILQIGGGNLQTIAAVSQWTPTLTVVTTVAAHGLEVGDTVTLANTDPEMDGTYVVSNVPTATTFVIPLVTPTIPAGVRVQGMVRSLLVTNSARDVGIQSNWHTGLQTGSAGARAAYFGFRRSTQRFTYFVTGGVQNGVFVGQLGDAEFNAVYATGLSAANLIAPLDAGVYTVSGSAFNISGGLIDNTPIGSITPSTGVFTNLRVSGLFQVDSTAPVANLNASMVGGKLSTDFVWRDGTMPLTANWNAGVYRVTSAQLAASSLASDSVVFTDIGGVLNTDASFGFSATTKMLTVGAVSGFTLAGTIEGGGHIISNVHVLNGDISACSVTLTTVDDVLDASAGTVVFGGGQLHGEWIAGGTAACDISGNANTVTNGVYTTLFGNNTIVKADTAANPVALTVPERTLIGRPVGGVITALDAAAVRDIINVAEKGTTDVYESGALMRGGNLVAPDAGMMMGVFSQSVEHVQTQSDVPVTLNANVNVSFVYVSASSASEVALITLPDGIRGMIKWVIVYELPAGTVANVRCALAAPDAPVATGLWTDVSLTSTMLMWNDLTAVWVIASTGMKTFDPRSPPVVT